VSLTNAFSKKLENHAAMVALYFMFYNFGRVHQMLRVTPAMEAGCVADVKAGRTEPADAFLDEFARKHGLPR